MQFSESWLREWVDPALDSEALAEQLTMAGLEIDGVTAAGRVPEGVVAARIEACRPHPDADRLTVCQVDAGDQRLQVVCGAPNARAGLVAPLALIGTRLGDGEPLQAARLRGVDSAGMLCSAAELALGDAGDGLMELPADSAPGTPLQTLLDLDDPVIDVDLTPNRGDCLSLRGIAREVGVLNELAVRERPIEPVPAAHEDTVPVTLSAGAACPRYAGRIIREVDNRAATPLWLRERLRRAGLRCIQPLVDVTNYVMLELGQPMHAFDLARLDGPAIDVRWARAGERLRLLNGDEVEQTPDVLLIGDGAGPVALGGVMGGEASMTRAETCDVFLEAAHFNPAAVAGRARRYHLSSDAAHRFERGVDFELPAVALERATELILAICGGRPGPVGDTHRQADLPRREPIRLRRSRIELLLGSAPEDSWIEAALARLGMSVAAEDGGVWQVTPPSFRFDVAIEADLIEEVARIWGFERLPAGVPLAGMHVFGDRERQRPPRDIRAALIARGYSEAITYSFVDRATDRRLGGDRPAVALANPLSSDMDVMRTSLWPGLLKALIYNRNRQAQRVRLFELGMAFWAGDGQPVQRQELAVLAAGPRWPEHWDLPADDVDFYDLKADLVALLDPEAGLTLAAKAHPALHPGQSAEVLIGGRPAGWMGMLHPEIAAEMELEGAVALLSVDLEAVQSRSLPAFRPLSRFPAVRRDISLVVDDSVPAEAILACIEAGRPEHLENLQLFDVYRGEGIDSGKKSLALGLIFRGSSSTLIDAQVDAAVGQVVSRLRTELGASLRE